MASGGRVCAAPSGSGTCRRISGGGPAAAPRKVMAPGARPTGACGQQGAPRVFGGRAAAVKGGVLPVRQPAPQRLTAGRQAGRRPPTPVQDMARYGGFGRVQLASRDAPPPRPTPSSLDLSCAEPRRSCCCRVLRGVALGLWPCLWGCTQYIMQH